MSSQPPEIPVPDSILTYLKVLGILNYVHAGLITIGSLFPLIYFVIGLVVVLEWIPASPSADNDETMMVGAIFLGLGAIGILACLGFAFISLCLGVFLQRHQYRLFCIIASGVIAILMPFGTCLGVFTIINLAREDVKTLFNKSSLNPH